MMYSALMFGTRFKKNYCKYSYTVIHIAALTIDRLHSATLLALFMLLLKQNVPENAVSLSPLNQLSRFPVFPIKFYMLGHSEGLLQTLFWTGNELYSTVQVIRLLSKQLMVIKDGDWKANNHVLVGQIMPNPLVTEGLPDSKTWKSSRCINRRVCG